MHRSVSEGHSLLDLHQTSGDKGEYISVPPGRSHSLETMLDEQLAHFPIGNVAYLDFARGLVEQQETWGLVHAVGWGEVPAEVQSVP